MRGLTVGGGISVRVEGIPEARAMLSEYDGRSMQNRLRRAVRAGAQPFVPALKEAAAGHHGGAGNVPLSFAKVPAPKVTTHGGSGRDVEAYVRPKSPLFNIFEPGAGAHTIAPHHGQLEGAIGESGWTEQGRKRPQRFFARGPVRHPGMSARPILPEAFRSRERAAGDAAAHAIFDPAGGRQ